MEHLETYLIILIAGLFVVVQVRWSRKRFEDKFGSPTANENWQSFGIFLIWMSVFSVGMLTFPKFFGWVYLLLLICGVPIALSKPNRTLTWRIQESACLAFFSFIPIAYIYYFI